MACCMSLLRNAGQKGHACKYQESSVRSPRYPGASSGHQARKAHDSQQTGGHGSPGTWRRENGSLRLFGPTHAIICFLTVICWALRAFVNSRPLVSRALPL